MPNPTPVDEVQHMTEVSLVGDPSQGDRQEWDDIEDVASELFNVWASGGDLEWAKTAWQALTRAGMTTYTSEAERTICMVRLIALSALYREFCVRAFDEGSSSEWQELITGDLVGDYPLLDAFTLGQLAERLQIDVDNPSLYESDPLATTFVILELVERKYRGVVDALTKQWGENAFFTSLWISAEPDYDEDDDADEGEEDNSSPVTGNQINRVMNEDVTGNKGYAYSWFSDGLSL
jgi:hypothetical protein